MQLEEINLGWGKRSKREAIESNLNEEAILGTRNSWMHGLLLKLDHDNCVVQLDSPRELRYLEYRKLKKLIIVNPVNPKNVAVKLHKIYGISGLLQYFNKP